MDGSCEPVCTDVPIGNGYSIFTAMCADHGTIFDQMVVKLRPDQESRLREKSHEALCLMTAFNYSPN
jgi:hypothetical protein